MRWVIAAVELYFLIWFVLIGIEAFMQRVTGLKSPFDLLEFHHAYIGAALVALGFWMHTPLGISLQMLGLIFTIDDLVQHGVQTYSGDRDYQSPLHQLFGKTLWRVPGVPMLMAFLDARWWALVLIGGIALLAFGCGPSRLVPIIPRPDTRFVAGVLITQPVGQRSLELLQAALPKEGSLCYYGGARDTTIDGIVMQILEPVRVEAARSDSSSEFNVWYPRGVLAGCVGTGLIGIAHSHPYAAEPNACTHSDPDAYVLFADPAALFSIVFCGDGRLEVMYQDGRRVPNRWRK